MLQFLLLNTGKLRVS